MRVSFDHKSRTHIFDAIIPQELQDFATLSHLNVVDFPLGAVMLSTDPSLALLSSRVIRKLQPQMINIPIRFRVRGCSIRVNSFTLL